jgi:hypothetical protein
MTISHAEQQANGIVGSFLRKRRQGVIVSATSCQMLQPVFALALAPILFTIGLAASPCKPLSHHAYAAAHIAAAHISFCDRVG